MNFFVSNNGFNCMYIGFIDENGKRIERTKYSHPYNYDAFVQERCAPNGKATNTVYTDRLLERDYHKTRALIKKHFKDTGIDIGGDYWDARPAKAIEGFLREWFNKPNLKVALVMECCNQSTGYPLWRIDFYEETPKKSLPPVKNQVK